LKSPRRSVWVGHSCPTDFRVADRKWMGMGHAVGGQECPPHTDRWPGKPAFGWSGDVPMSQTWSGKQSQIVLMPWRLTRFQRSGQSHFVTFCCYHRRRSFTTDASRRIFASALERVRCWFRLQGYGYVVREGFTSARVGSEPRFSVHRTDANLGHRAEATTSAAFGGKFPLKPKAGLNGPPSITVSALSRDTWTRERF